MGGGPATKEVDAVDDNTNPTGFSFKPATLTVNKGDTVVFKNTSTDQHGIAWDTAGAPPNTGLFGPGTSTSVVMSNAGTFNYHCFVHGAQMNGQITVNP